MKKKLHCSQICHYYKSPTSPAAAAIYLQQHDLSKCLLKARLQNEHFHNTVRPE